MLARIEMQIPKKLQALCLDSPCDLKQLYGNGLTDAKISNLSAKIFSPKPVEWLDLATHRNLKDVVIHVRALDSIERDFLFIKTLYALVLDADSALSIIPIIIASALRATAAAGGLSTLLEIENIKTFALIASLLTAAEQVVERASPSSTVSVKQRGEVVEVEISSAAQATGALEAAIIAASAARSLQKMQPLIPIDALGLLGCFVFVAALLAISSTKQGHLEAEAKILETNAKEYRMKLEAFKGNADAFSEDVQKLRETFEESRKQIHRLGESLTTF